MESHFGKSALDRRLPALLLAHPPLLFHPRKSLDFWRSSPSQASPTPGTQRLSGRASGPDNLPLSTPTPRARSQDLAGLFQRPGSPAQGRYEVGHADFSESMSADPIADRFRLPADAV